MKTLVRTVGFGYAVTGENRAEVDPTLPNLPVVRENGLPRQPRRLPSGGKKEICWRSVI